MRKLALLRLVLGLGACLGGSSGCAALRNHHINADLRPCADDYAVTADGWKLGVKRYRPARPDPAKLPVVLCHGLGLNGTFWTITDDHLPGQLAAHGYEVFVVDMRGSGASRRQGFVGHINSAVRQTMLLEIGSGDWTVDHEAFYDVPAILDLVQQRTGHSQVNWVGHSLGGMLMFPYLELQPQPQRIATFVAMGSPAVLLSAPETKMLRANRGLRVLLSAVSTSRMSRGMMVGRPPGLDKIDRLYYSAENVDDLTTDRFYGYTLEDPGRGALQQLEIYLARGRLVSANGKVDYAGMLDRVQVPILYVAGDGDVLAPLHSVVWTYEETGSRDKALYRFGVQNGYKADYGHCDLVWSRHAPKEIFPAVIAWLDARQPARPSSQSAEPVSRPAPQATASAGAPRTVPLVLQSMPPEQETVQADLRPRLEPLPDPPDLVQIHETAVGQP